MHKVWIEAALNGPWSRKFQPGIPDTVEAIIAEGVACARAGATIVHLHAYDGGGPQTYDWQVYARIFEGIRNQIDVPVYPSFDRSCSTMSTPLSPTQRAVLPCRAVDRAWPDRIRHCRSRQHEFHPEQDDIG